MTNTFPYTDVGRLWTDMYAARVSGPMFDMVCMVYVRMTYAVRFGDEHSLPFRSLIGLLTGDTASPTLWNIFFADYRLPPHKDDVHLNGRPVSQAEQADDNLIMSTSFYVFQSKVTMFYKWTINKRAFASGDKSRWQNRATSASSLSASTPGVELAFDARHSFHGNWSYAGTHLPTAARTWSIGVHAVYRPRHVVHLALLDSVALFRQGKPGWASDLAVMLKHLLTAIDVEPEDLLSISRIDSSKKEIVRIVDVDLQHDIDNLVKTHMLRNRLESGEQKSVTLVTRATRAMTGLLLGDHNLSVEHLHYPARYREVIPPQHKLCRFCQGGVEDEVHALFDCTADPRLVELRSQFLKTLMICDSTTWDSYTKISSYDFMLELVPSRKAVQVFAKYIFLILSLHAETPRHFPVTFRIPG
ncbi:hypothetical protein B0H13DRAFT_2327434 [Mycena leptocephala]|nr:hypothetical protein B0H13DRAFT_2327434 [Mycena leptocephala]